MTPTGHGEARWAMRWKPALNAFADAPFNHGSLRLATNQCQVRSAVYLTAPMGEFPGGLLGGWRVGLKVLRVAVRRSAGGMSNRPLSTAVTAIVSAPESYYLVVHTSRHLALLAMSHLSASVAQQGRSPREGAVAPTVTVRLWSAVSGRRCAAAPGSGRDHDPLLIHQSGLHDRCGQRCAGHAPACRRFRLSASLPPRPGRRVPGGSSSRRTPGCARTRPWACGADMCAKSTIRGVALGVLSAVGQYADISFRRAAARRTIGR